MASLFKNLDIKGFMKKKPPRDDSFDTNQEIKQLSKTPMNKKFVTEKDDIESTFKSPVAGLFLLALQLINLASLNTEFLLSAVSKKFSLALRSTLKDSACAMQAIKSISATYSELSIKSLKSSG